MIFNTPRASLMIILLISVIGCRPRSSHRNNPQTIDHTEQTNETTSLLSATPAIAGTPWTSIQTAGTFPTSSSTADRSQSKVWNYGGKYWAIMPKTDGVYLFVLEGHQWRETLKLSTLTNAYADTVVSGNLVHALLYVSNISHMIHLEYVPGSATGYKLWTSQPAQRPIFLDRGVEVATLAKDTKNRLWVISDITSVIVARWSAAPYTTWSAPIVVASGVGSTDISAVVALPNASIGVFWSNQITKRFGFRAHFDSDAPATWRAPETPGDLAALSIGGGMADAQFHVTSTPDGTVLAAIKTKYNTFPQTQLGLLVRRPTGIWDNNLYAIDVKGANPAVSYSSESDTVRVFYNAARAGSNVLLSESKLSNIRFSEPRVVLQGAFANVSIPKQPPANESIAIASTTGQVSAVRMISRTGEGTPIFVGLAQGELPDATTERIQNAIYEATAKQTGIFFERNGVFEISAPLTIKGPGPVFISGANATIRKVAGTGAVLRVESAQDGFVLEDLRLLGGSLPHKDNIETCAVEWPETFATSGVVLNGVRWGRLRNVTIRNVSDAAVLIEPMTGPVSHLQIDRTQIRDSGEGFQLIGTSANPVSNVSITGSTVFFTKRSGFSSKFAQDISWQGGSIEKTLGDFINATDSKRLAFYTYVENYGGWIYKSATPVMTWCPRDASTTAARLVRSSDFLFRGRIGSEADRNGAGPVVSPTSSSCYSISNKGSMLAAAACPVAGLTPPAPVSGGYNFGGYSHTKNDNEILLLPSDTETELRSKFITAAQSRLGVRLLSNQVYNWPPIVFANSGDTPAYFEGNGSTINIVTADGTAPAIAAIRAIHPTNWPGRDKFSIRRLNLNVNGKANHGISIEGAQFAEVADVKISGAKAAAFHADGKPGAGFYYNSISDLTSLNNGAGVEIISTINSKYANANFIRNLKTTNTSATLSLHWTSSTVSLGIDSDLTGMPAGAPKYLVDTSFSSDIEMRGVTVSGAPLSDAVLKKGIAVEGIYYSPGY